MSLEEKLSPQEEAKRAEKARAILVNDVLTSPFMYGLYGCQTIKNNPYLNAGSEGFKVQQLIMKL